MRSVLGNAAFDAAFASGRSLDRDAVLMQVRTILQDRLRVIPNNVDRLAKHYRLTRKETEVFRELAQRRSNSEIAEACFVNIRTAQDNVQHIMSKFGVNTRWNAAARLDEL